jgi:hypothetical protein
MTLGGCKMTPDESIIDLIRCNMEVALMIDDTRHRIPPARTDLGDYSTSDELAEYVRVSVATVYGWRSRGGGPVGTRVGSRTLYAREDILRWLRERRAAS